MSIDERFIGPVNVAFAHYEESRNVGESIAILTKAVHDDQIPLGLFNEAKAAFDELLTELAIKEDGMVPNEWEQIKGKSFSDLIGYEHTERDIDTAAQSGEMPIVADSTSP